ncbi:MAG: hypothetical protein AUJ92_04440 [Armatimonadetes bacterium CG2_30_59_28]|nr:MAG: hypothetical protein AUJ92_04440 [Armatimonadetes bacterium CG2_30_59_28]PIU67596.1 MAG: hypothetical protein COS85_00055 [Armatimonadetes bacterium CG07_land_8_20_14_0_80_59_28]PIX42038.1 MAG: hypothetical protein COZ56_10265 [Armatimonadetes bacterium CG_4_8_14_3_um_filter_58_9]
MYLQCSRTPAHLCSLPVVLTFLLATGSAELRAAPSPARGPTGKVSPPAVGKVGLWEAEAGQRVGDWLVVKHPLASGGVYMKPGGADTAHRLEFAIEAREPVSLRVWPVFWRHGDRRPVRRFPYPLPRQPGPDCIDWADVDGQRRLFITSPATGSLSSLSVDPPQLRTTAQPGGYLSDMVMDRSAGRLFLADATGDRIISLPTADLSSTNDVAVQGAPWSLALGGNRLYVGTQKGGEVVAIDPETRKVVARSQTQFQIAHVDYEEASSPRVLVWPMPAVFDLDTLTAQQPDREQFAAGRRTSAETGRRNTPDWKRFRPAGPHALLIESFTGKDWVRRTLDTSSVTKVEGAAQKFSYPLTGQPGPDILAVVGEVVLFTAPLAGRVGIVNIASGEIAGSVSVGGYLSDLIADAANKRAYAVDATGNRLVSISVAPGLAAGKVATVTQVPATPVSVDLFLPPPHLKNADSLVFVACWQDKKVAAFTPDRLEKKWEADLPGNPKEVTVLYRTNPAWWGTIPADRIDFEIRPKLSVTLNPVAFETNPLKPLGPVATATRFTRRSSVSLDLAEGEKQSFFVDNQHTVQTVTETATPPQREENWLDVSEVTDPQLIPSAPALTSLDDPGAAILSIDGGPSLPWRREIWKTPDQLQLLMNDTPEFWRWNAPVVHLDPGQHVLKVETRSNYALLDALKVERTLKDTVSFSVSPVSATKNSLPERYRSLFYAEEPVAFDIQVKNILPHIHTLKLAWRVTNYLGETVLSDAAEIHVGGGADNDRSQTQSPSHRVSLNLRDTGTFTLTVSVRSDWGEDSKDVRFVRLPRLERPRMLFRREDVASIQARVNQNPILFAHYFSWLQKRCETPGFLPGGLTGGTLIPALPEAQQKLAGSGAWRRYDFAWRMLAVQLGAQFAPESAQREYFGQRMAKLLMGQKTDYYCTFHHHGPFAPGVVASLVDLAAANPGQADAEVKGFKAFFRQYIGDMNVLPWTLAALEDPLSPQERAILWHIGMWLFNAERYFEYHMGQRGGTRWIGPRTWCHCPYASFGYPFIYLPNILDEKKFQYRNSIGDFLTYSELLLPYRDTRQMLGEPGPKGEPLKWIDSARSKNPLLKRKYNWEELIKKISSTDLTDEQLNMLLDYPESACTTAPMAFAVPLGLALGWYDPDDPEVDVTELPPTLLFDVEGEVVMHSDWTDNLTEVAFKCGVRDHVYREQPTHLRISRGGDWLLGTASSCGDDGNPAPGKSWGNVVVVEPSDWLRRWGENFWHPRGEEYCVTNRFSDAAFGYIARDRRLVKYAPAEGGFGGGLDFHGHTQSFLVQEGELLAYETWPKFDYMAGDATNSWPVDLADEVQRQVLFLKPDTVVIYDRLRLGPKAKQTRWVAATGENLKIDGKQFLVKTGKSVMGGEVLLPAAPRLEAFNPKESNKYSTPPRHSVNWFLFDGRTNFQQVLEITAPANEQSVEYLVVLKTAAAVADSTASPLPRITPIATDGYAGASWKDGSAAYRVRFLRDGLAGGDLTIQGSGTPFSHRFMQKVDDSYRHWKSHPLYREWMDAPRFKFLHIK